MECGRRNKNLKCQWEIILPVGIMDYGKRKYSNGIHGMSVDPEGRPIIGGTGRNLLKVGQI